MLSAQQTMPYAVSDITIKGAVDLEKKKVSKQCKGNHYIVLYVRKDIFRETFDTELTIFADVSL